MSCDIRVYVMPELEDSLSVEELNFFAGTAGLSAFATFAKKALGYIAKNVKVKSITSETDKFQQGWGRCLEISLVSDEAITKIHEEFFGIAGSTDVITFPCELNNPESVAEIIISADTARQNAVEFNHKFTREILLYVVHGLLHLRGYDDKTKSERAEMQVLQEHVLNILC